MKSLKTLIFAGMILAFMTGCDDDEGNMPTSQNFTVTIENVVTPQPYFASGSFAVPVGQSSPAPLFPGDEYQITINAGPSVTPMDGGTRLSFATMFVQSNDLFLAPDGAGISLYNSNGNPVGGGAEVDVTNQVLLWDAGTEINDVTGSASQKPQQAPMAADIGTDENGVVSRISGNSDGTNVLPAVSDVIQVTVEHQGGTEFLVRMVNVSNGNTIATPAQGVGTTAAVPISPGVFIVHTSDNPMFTEGEEASEGIEDIAEDGFFDVELERAGNSTGLIVPLSPGVWAVHDDGTNPLFNVNMPDFGEGLEAIAEDGAAATAANSLVTKAGVSNSGMFNTPVGMTSPGAIGPGGSYTFSFTASSGDRLSLATMMVQSNDWIYSFSENGIALFNGDNAVTGDVTSSLNLYDVGTEADEFPGAGLNQVIRQSSADAGSADPNTNVRAVNSPPSNVPALSDVIRVIISQ